MADGYERDDGMETSSGAHTAAARVRDAAGAKSRDLLDRAVEQKDELKQRAAGMADDRRLQAAGRAESISRALQGAADSLRENGEPQLSGWVSQAAGQVERIVGYMQGKPADGMLHDFEDLARRNPALFLGGTYLAGMAVGRFLRASSPQPEFSAAYGTDDASPRLERVSGYGSSGYAAGDGEPGLTDEELREAWHDDTRRGMDGGYGAASSPHGASVDTGELTSYTNPGDGTSPQESFLDDATGRDDLSDPRRGVS